MKLEQLRLFPFLLGSLLAMLIGLVGLAVILAHSATTLEEVHRVVVEDSAPSVVELEAASAKLGRLEELLRDRLHVNGRERGPLEAEIQETWKDLQDNIAGYNRLPIDPGEAEARAQISGAMRGLDGVMKRIVDGPSQSPDELAHALDESVTRLSEAVLKAATIDADLLSHASGRLLTIRNWALPSALALEVLCLCAAAFSLVAAYRVVRSAAASSAESRRQLELRMSELEAFSGRVAHDLLSPLMTVSLALGAAESSLAQPEHGRVHGMVSRAITSLQRVRQTVGDLLDFARAGAMPTPNARADAQAVLREVIDDFEPIAEVQRVTLATEASSRRQVRCSAGVLRSVLANLVQNAIKYIDGGPDRRVTVRSADTGSDVRFEVEDTGAGIPAEDQQKIFEPYVRRNAGGAGLGLGLATVKRLVEAHGGQVGVLSPPGRGACFWVVLPGVS
ncbi:MAG: ATP-binding protein [Minicystis sp.]